MLGKIAFIICFGNYKTTIIKDLSQALYMKMFPCPCLQEERSKVDELRGSPMSVGTLEEIIDDNHAIVSTSVGSEHYVSILSFVDKDQLEPGCSVLLNHKVFSAYQMNTNMVWHIFKQKYLHVSFKMW